MFLDQGPTILNSSIKVMLQGHHLHTVTNIDVTLHSIVTIPPKRIEIPDTDMEPLHIMCYLIR